MTLADYIMMTNSNNGYPTPVYYVYNPITGVMDEYTEKEKPECRNAYKDEVNEHSCSWQLYVGFTESYNFCDCGKKKELNK